MMKKRQVLHVESGQILIPAARWCDTFGQKLRGFTFHAPIGEDEGLVLVETADFRLNSGIHMLFVSFDLGVLWVNSQGRVVDTVVAKPWRLSYMPQEPAQYIVEGHPKRLMHVRVGDTIQFLEAAAK